MAKRIVWTEQAKSDVRGIDQPVALQILKTLARYAQAYGTRLERVIGGARATAELGVYFGGDLHGNEIRYLQDQEWAMTADDVLWRRSKLGLHAAPETVAAVERWFDAAPTELRAGAR